MDIANALGRYLVKRGEENRVAWDGRRRGFYEVWYLTFNVPEERVAFWFRYTLDAPQNGDPYVELWGHFFDGNSPERRFGLRRRWSAKEAAWDGKEIFRIGDTWLKEDAAKGNIEQNGHSLSWELSFTPSLTALFMAPVALRPFFARKRTNWCVPNIDIRLQGHVTVDGRTFNFFKASGQQAHLFGRQHAENWAWTHCNTFDQDRSAIVEALAAGLMLGGTTRAVTAVYVCYDGKDYLCNALFRALRASSERRFPEWQFKCQASGTTFVGKASAAPENMLQVVYADPDGTPSYCCNTELGNLMLEVHRGGKQIDVLTASGTAHVEFGDRQSRTDVPTCPCPE